MNKRKVDEKKLYYLIYWTNIKCYCTIVSVLWNVARATLDYVFRYWTICLNTLKKCCSRKMVQLKFHPDMNKATWGVRYPCWSTVLTTSSFNNKIIQSFCLLFLARELLQNYNVIHFTQHLQSGIYTESKTVTSEQGI